MTPTRMLFARGTLPPGLAGSRIVGALHARGDGTISAANDTFLRMAGRSREELERGELHWRLLFGSDTLPVEAWQSELIRPDDREMTVLVEPVQGDETAENDGCTALVVDVSATRIAEAALTRAREVLEERTEQLSGAHQHMNAATADLETERRRVEELALHLANANRELDAFSYSVSHDLRAPLRSIDGFSRVLLTNYGEQLDDRGRDYLQRVRNATTRMANLLDDLLRLARTSKAALTATEVDLSTGAQQIADELQQRAPERRATWKIQPGLTAHGDRALLRVVLQNLLENAWKFTSKCEECVIEVGQDDGVFFVRDNGAGFDMKYADQLFGVFQRLHSANEFEGTGIGLATVQRIIHRHRGSIRAEGAVGRGATFFFTLGEKRPL